MELILIRHGEPDYSEVTERKYIGHGRDLAKLTELGKAQAEKVSRDERLRGAEIIKYKGEWNPECKYRWESFSQVGERAFEVIRKYLGYKKVIVVAHGVLMRQFVYMKDVPNCEVITMKFDEKSQYNGYVEDGATSLPTKNELAIASQSGYH